MGRSRHLAGRDRLSRRRLSRLLALPRSAPAPSMFGVGSKGQHVASQQPPPQLPCAALPCPTTLLPLQCASTARANTWPALQSLSCPRAACWWRWSGALQQQGAAAGVGQRARRLRAARHAVPAAAGPRSPAAGCLTPAWSGPPAHALCSSVTWGVTQETTMKLIYSSDDGGSSWQRAARVGPMNWPQVRRARCATTDMRLCLTGHRDRGGGGAHGMGLC